MIEINGAFNTAVCYCSELEPSAAEQIRQVCDQKAFGDCKIRIMPDVHAGMGCTIGTTMTITDKVVPGMVGVDIGCGMETVLLKEKDIDLAVLDNIIHSLIPCGREVRNTAHKFASEIDLEQLRCRRAVDLSRASKSIGTLGGGNHFIEIDRDDSGNLYLVVHSGSRHLGKEVAKYYQNEGFKALKNSSKTQLKEIIETAKSEGRLEDLDSIIADLKRNRRENAPVSRDLAYVEGALFDDYIHDMKIVQKFASLNRLAMTDIIIAESGLTETERFTTIHNYIDTDNMILRKGAVSAKKGQKLLIPINMRDGSLICIGKGNDDWNCSAPHGAGRLMSRRQAFDSLSMDEYRTKMEGIYTTCVSRDTLDESPMAYKSMDDIVSHISPTAEITHVIKPIYNFKASE